MFLLSRRRLVPLLTLLVLTIAGGVVSAQSSPRQEPAPPQHPRPSAAAAPAATAPRPTALPRIQWWKDESIRKDLVLTNEQVVHIDGIFQATIPQLRQGLEELNRREDKLSHLIATAADEAMVTREIDRVEAVRSSVNKTRTLMHMHIRQVLTPDQRVRFAAMFDQQQNEQKAQTAKRQ